MTFHCNCTCNREHFKLVAGNIIYECRHCVAIACENPGRRSSVPRHTKPRKWYFFCGVNKPEPPKMQTYVLIFAHCVCAHGSRAAVSGARMHGCAKRRTLCAAPCATFCISLFHERVRQDNLKTLISVKYRLIQVLHQNLLFIMAVFSSVCLSFASHTLGRIVSSWNVHIFDEPEEHWHRAYLWWRRAFRLQHSFSLWVWIRRIANIDQPNQWANNANSIINSSYLVCFVGDARVKIRLT